MQKNFIITVLAFFSVMAWQTVDKLNTIANSVKVISTPPVKHTGEYEYNIILDMDSIHVYENDEYVGSVAHGTSAIDTLFWKAND